MKKNYVSNKSAQEARYHDAANDMCYLILACGPKTVPVKRTFLNIAIVGWSRVGWGGMLTFLVLRKDFVHDILPCC